MDDASMYPDRWILKGDLRTSSDCNEIALVTQVVGRATEVARRIFDELCALRDDCTISSFETTLLMSSDAGSVCRVSLLTEVGLNPVPTIELGDCGL